MRSCLKQKDFKEEKEEEALPVFSRFPNPSTVLGSTDSGAVVKQNVMAVDVCKMLSPSWQTK